MIEFAISCLIYRTEMMRCMELARHIPPPDQLVLLTGEGGDPTSDLIAAGSSLQNPIAWLQLHCAWQVGNAKQCLADT